MSAILFRGTQQKPWNTFTIIILSFTFFSLEMSRAATENPENVSVVEMTFTGTGPNKTRLFTVKDGWKIEWETESPSFKLSAHGSARRPYVSSTNEREKILRRFEAIQPIVLANTSDQKGKAVHPLGGTFYFTVIAKGPWRIDLKTFKDTKDYLDVPYTGAP